MGYLSLYRKWRPKTFDDLAGQPTVTKTLKNAINNQRIAHAYLFCGPRGTGKTSTAKTFAKALNCHNRDGINPCNKCFSCEQVNSGRSVDIIEIDAASNRRIDEIRELREKVKFTPSEGEYKVYIIDEVHMLTKEAFNALLKTLEEPPENVVFILATTEPHKVLPTIISRCQRFDFGLLSIRDLKSRLKYICAEEQVTITDGALNLIARTAEGGMRDAISILDQAIAFGGQEVTVDDVNTILGRVEQRVLAKIVSVIACHDSQAGLLLLNEIINQGKDIYQFVKDLLAHIRDLLLIRECGLQNNLIELPDELKEELASQAQKFTTKELLKILETISEADQKLRFASQPRLVLEMMLIKLVTKEVDISISNLVNRLAALEELLENSGERGNSAKATKNIQPVQVNSSVSSTDLNDRSTCVLNEVSESTDQLMHTSPTMSGIESPGTGNDNNPDDSHESSVKVSESVVANVLPVISYEEMVKHWEVTMTLLNKSPETRKLRAFLANGKPSCVVGNTLFIVFPQSSTFHKANAEKEQPLIEKALKRVTGLNLQVCCIYEGEEPVATSAMLDNIGEVEPDVSISRELTKEEIEQDPLVQKVLKVFGGKVIQVENE